MPAFEVKDDVYNDFVDSASKNSVNHLDVCRDKFSGTKAVIGKNEALLGSVTGLGGSNETATGSNETVTRPGPSEIIRGRPLKRSSTEGQPGPSHVADLSAKPSDFHKRGRKYDYDGPLKPGEDPKKKAAAKRSSEHREKIRKQLQGESSGKDNAPSLPGVQPSCSYDQQSNGYISEEMQNESDQLKKINAKTKEVLENLEKRKVKNILEEMAQLREALEKREKDDAQLREVLEKRGEEDAQLRETLEKREKDNAQLREALEKKEKNNVQLRESLDEFVKVLLENNPQDCTRCDEQDAIVAEMLSLT